MDWEKTRMNPMVLESSKFYQKAKKCSKNDGDMQKDTEVGLKGLLLAKSRRIWAWK